MIPIVLASGAYTLTLERDEQAYAGAKSEVYIDDVKLSLVKLLPLAVLSCESEGCTHGAAKGKAANGIVDTENGNVNYVEPHTAVPVAGGALQFQTNYASGRADLHRGGNSPNNLNGGAYPQGSIGDGWVNNYDMRLILDDTLTQLPNTIEFQTPAGNYLPFFDRGAEGYEPYPGVLSDLEQKAGGGYKITMPNQTEHHFDAAGKLMYTEDADNNRIDFAYYGIGHVHEGKLHQVSQGSRFLTYAYHTSGSAVGQLHTVTDNAGRQTTLTYNADGRLEFVTNPAGEATEYQYDPVHGYLNRVIDPTGTTRREIDYDAQGRATTVRNGIGDVISTIVYGTDNRTAVTENGVTITHVYGEQRALAAIEYPCPDGNGTCTQDMTHDPNYRHSQVVDANGNGSNMDWDETGRNLTSATDALGHTTSFQYDGLNNLEVITDARNYPTYYYYDNPQYPTFRTREVNALGGTKIYTPTANGYLQAMQNETGLVTHYQYDAYGQPLFVTSAYGTAEATTTQYEYDAVGRLISTTNSFGLVTVNTYDAADRLVSVTRNYLAGQPQNYQDEYNLITTYGYDNAGRQTAVTDTVGRVNITVYDEAGRVSKQIQNYDGVSDVAALCTQTYYADPDPEHNICAVTLYDSHGRVYATRNALGQIQRTFYDAQGNVVGTVQNSVQITDVSQLDSCFALPTERDHDLCTKNEYDAVGNLIVATDVQGRKTRYFYDALNRTTLTVRNWTGGIQQPTDEGLCYETHGAANDADACSQQEYDEVGNTIIMTDAEGRMTRRFYDELNRVTASVTNWNPATLQSAQDCVIAADNMSTENICTLYGYDAAGKQMTVTNALGQTSLTVYDEAERRVASVQNWSGATPQTLLGSCNALSDTRDTDICSFTEYDDYGRRLAAIDPAGARTDFTYNSLGQVISTTQYLDGNPVVTGAEFDAAGLRIAGTDAEGHVTAYFYDSLNRLESTVSPVGTVMTRTYNAAGWLLATTNAQGHTTSHQHDDLGRIITTTNPLQHATGYTYEVGGNRVAKTDAAGVMTRYVYDDFNRLTGVVENDTGGAADSNSNVLTQYAYDISGNRLVVTNARSFTQTETVYDVLNRPVTVTDSLGNHTTYVYDALGNLHREVDGNGALTTYAYDGLNRVVSTTYHVDGETITYVYDEVGNRQIMTDGVGTTTYQYDDLYRPITVTDALTGTVVYGYDLNGNRTTLTYPDGKVVSYTYDADNRLDYVTDWNGDVTDYSYDVLGRLITTTLPNGIVSTNQYDAANRLINLSHRNGGEVVAEFAYGLDNVGNRVVVTETLPASLTALSTPSGSEPLTVTQEISTALLTEWQLQGDPLTPTDTQTVDRFGHALDMNEDFLVVGAFKGHVEWAHRSGYVDIYADSNGQWSWVQRLDQSTTTDPLESTAFFGKSVALEDNVLAIGSSTATTQYGAHTGAVYLYRYDENEGKWVYDTKIASADVADWERFGADIDLEPNRLLVSADYDDSRTGSAYIFDYDGSRWTQTAKLTAIGGGAPGDRFGFRVALDGDTAVIGAPFSDLNGTNSGAAYVYHVVNGIWSEDQILQPSAAQDHFGYAVDLLGESLIAVGAYRDDDIASNAGAVYLFDDSRMATESNGRVWNQIQKLTAADAQSSDSFGVDVKFNETRLMLTIGAHTEDDIASNSGAVYTFGPDPSNPSSWSQYDKYTSSQMLENERFGYRVAAQGDNVSTGALSHVDGSFSAGVYLFDSPTSNGIPIQPGRPLNAHEGYGRAVDVENDIMVVGAPSADENATERAGYVDILTYENGEWQRQQQLDQNDTPDDFASVGWFGRSVSLDGNLLAVSSLRASAGSGVDAGAVYLFAYDGTQWAYEATVRPNDPTDEMYFGEDIALDGNRLLIGACRDDQAGTNAGAAYIFEKSNGVWTQAVKFAPSEAYAYHGCAVDLDGDTAVVGAYLEDSPAGTNSGSAYVYRYFSGVWSPTTRLQSNDISGGDYFGSDVAIQGQTITVGAYGDDDNGSSSGSVYVFENSNGTWTQTAKLTAFDSDDQAWDTFGSKVALNETGDELVVGAYLDDDTAYQGGSAYHFAKENGSWVQQMKITDSRLSEEAWFGIAVAIHGNHLVVGSFRFASATGYSGGVFAYQRPDTSDMATTVIEYEYDDLYRLTDATYRGAISATYGYTYDAVGNMIHYEAATPTETKIEDRTYNAANQLIQNVVPIDEKTSQTTFYTYDGAGNLVEEEIPNTNRKVYQYNQHQLMVGYYEEVLTSFGSPPITLNSFVYDGDGNRVQTIIGGTTTTYVNDAVGMTQVLAANDGQETTLNLFGLDLIGQETVSNISSISIDLETGEVTESRPVLYKNVLLADGLGSVRVETADGRVTALTTYAPYGTVLTSTGTSRTTYGYTGEQHDAVTGLLYLRARYYNSALHTFTGRDPWAGDTMRPMTMHGYSYAYNNPVRLVDPTGYCGGDINNHDLFDSTGNVHLDCTLNNFEKAPITKRLEWIQAFARQKGMRNWFKNIEGIIEGFVRNNLSESGTWLSAVDAAILHAIQSGYAMHHQPGLSSASTTNPAAPLWRNFFERLAKSKSIVASGSQLPPELENELVRLWGDAEQAATNYGIRYAATRNAYPNNAPQGAAKVFLETGNVYRTMTKFPGGLGGPAAMVGGMSTLTLPLPQTMKTAYRCYQLGSWFNDPRSVDPWQGKSPVYWYSSFIWKVSNHTDYPISSSSMLPSGYTMWRTDVPR